MSFLGVNKSLTNRCWSGPTDKTLEKAASISKELSISILSALQLVKLNLETEGYDKYINPKVRDLMPDPKSFLDMNKGAKRLLAAIEKKEKIAIFADYDVDGTVSASLITIWLKNFSITPTVYIPDREKEGFGPNYPAMKKLAQKNSLIICVDCGSDSDIAIKGASEEKTDVIIIDHHRTEKKPDNAFALINPNQMDESNFYSYLCAAGVVFLFLVHLTTLQKEKKTHKINLLDYLDLVGLATIADVSPLVGLNRAFVTQGLKIFKKRPCLKKLLEKHNLEKNLTEEKIAFQVAPRLNASGRLNTGLLSYQFLIATDHKTIDEALKKIENLNLQRKELEKIIFDAANKNIIGDPANNSHIVSRGKNWHKGLIGIIAARLKENFNKPATVITIDNENIGHGSIRSVEGVDLTIILSELKNKNILLSGGGHKMAAGFTIDSLMIDEFNQIFSNCLKDQLKSKIEIEKLDLHGLIGIDTIDTNLVEELHLLGPFGSKVPVPIVVVPNCSVVFSKIIGGSHIICKFQRKGNDSLDAVCFNAVNNMLGEALLKKNNQLHVACQLMVDDWHGIKKPKIKIVDLAPSQNN